MSSYKSSTESTLRELRLKWQVQCSDYINAISWSPGGNYLAVVDAGGSASVLDSGTGDFLKTWQAHSNGALRVGWSARGNRLASSGQDGCVNLYDGVSLKQLKVLSHGHDWVEHLAWNSRKDVLLTAAGKDMKLWDVEGRLIREFVGHSNTISALMWNPASVDSFATSTYNGVRLWNCSQEEPERVLGWKGSLLDLAYSPDGKTLAVGCQDGAAHVWHLPDGDDLFMNGYQTKLRELTWDKTSSYLATGGGDVVIVWDFSGSGPSGRKPLTLSGHEGFVSVLAFSPKDLKLVSGGLDGKVFVWNLSSGQAELYSSHSDSEVVCLTWSPDGKSLAVGSSSGVIALFDF